MMNSDVRGVVVAHADLARALIAAVEGISGVTDALRPVSNDRLGPEDLREAIAEAAGDEAAILFVDLGGGSCGLASVGHAKAARRAACITGVNLPMLLDFVFHRDMPLEQLVPRLLEKGHAGQTAHWGPAAPAG